MSLRLKLPNTFVLIFGLLVVIAVLTWFVPGGKYATVMAEGRFIQPEDLGFEREDANLQTMSLEDARAAAESMMIRRALSQSRNQISRAASLLGVSRVTLYRLIEKYNIRSEMMPPARPGYLNSAKPEMEARK